MFAFDGNNTTQSTYNCSNTLFLDHGIQTTSITVFNVFSTAWEWEWHNTCRDDYACLGYTYRVDYWICSLSHDRISLDAFPCNVCNFFEKTCHLRCLERFFLIRVVYNTHVLNFHFFNGWCFINNVRLELYFTQPSPLRFIELVFEDFLVGQYLTLLCLLQNLFKKT